MARPRLAFSASKPMRSYDDGDDDDGDDHDDVAQDNEDESEND